MSEARTLIFEIYRDGELVRTERLAQDVIKIGSHAKSHLQLDDGDVSLVHAYVEASDDEVSIIDLGSGRGTFVNGEKVNKATLHHRDEIVLGSTRLVFLTRDEKAIAAAAEEKRIAELRSRPSDEVVYARRFLARPATTDGAVEVAMLYHDYVMAEELFRPPSDVKIGSTASCRFEVDESTLGSDEFTLIDASGGEPALCFTASMTGEVYVGTERLTLRQAIETGRASRSGNHASISLTADTRARIVIGEQVFFVHRSTKPAVALPMQADFASMGIFIVLSAMLHAAFLAMITFWPVGMGSLDLDAFNGNDRFVQILIEDAQEEEEEPEPEVAEDEGEDEGEEEDQQDQAAAGDEGRAGDEETLEDDGRMAIEGDADPRDIELARSAAVESVQSRGALQVLNQVGPSGVFGEMPVGADAVYAIGGVDGATAGPAYGTRGLGRYGGGLSAGGRNLGGGGLGAGTLALATRGVNNGDSRFGSNQLGEPDYTARVPTLEVGSGEVRGQLDREIIQRVVREHRREIRACYEGELQRNPDLEGAITVEWVIAPDGAVAGARVQDTSLNSSAVENCVTRRIQQWVFPEPRGGGTVRVTFPFVFAPGG